MLRLSSRFRANARVRFIFSLMAPLWGLVAILLVISNTVSPGVQAAPSTYLNFQARLLTNSGAVVPDGYYHVEFKLYNVASGGTTQWTETWSSADNSNRIRIVNGYLTANLGADTAFPGTIAWDEQQWLTMNIGGTAGTASWDGEMNPRIMLTALPYAFKSAETLAVKKISGANSGTLSFGTVANNPVIGLPDASGTVCLQGAAACGFIQNGTTLQANANFNIQSAAAASIGGVIRGATSQTANLFQLQDSAGTILTSFDSSGKLVFGPSGAQDTNLYRSASNTLKTDDNFLVQTATNSTNAFQVQRGDASTLFNVDTINRLVINNGTSYPGNLLQNPGFESTGTGTGTGYTINAQATIATNASNARTGNSYLSVTPNTTNLAVAYSAQFYAVQPGDIVYYEGYVRNTTGTDGGGGFYLEYYDKDLNGNAFSSGDDWSNPGTSYVLRTNTQTVPAGSYFVRITPTVRNTSTTGTWYFDDLYLKRSTEQAPIVLRNSVNTASALQVQNAVGVTQFTVDSVNERIAIGNVGGFSDSPVKLANPATLPTGNGTSTAFSPDGTYMSVAHFTSPFITIYKRSGDTFTKLADPATLPTGNGEGVAFSADGTYMSVAHATTPFITIYKRSGDTFTKLADPATLPAGISEGVGFSPDGTYMSVAHTTTPFTTIYKGSGGPFRKLEIASHQDASGGLGFGKEIALYRSAPGLLSLAAGSSLQIDSGNLTVQGNIQIQTATGTSLLSADSANSKLTVGGDIVASAVATATTATTSGTGTNTTIVTLTAGSFANGDVIFIDNAGQDYYTRITAGGGTTSLTVSPAVTFETTRTVTKYIIQNVGATATDYTTLTNRFFQGYFLGGVVTGAGSTTLSDGRLHSTNSLNFNATSYNFKNSADSTTAFQLQNASSQTLLVADTVNQRIAIGPGAVPANSVLTVGTDTTAATGGIYFGTDTSLYRSAAGVLRSDGSFELGEGNDRTLKVQGRTTNAVGNGLTIAAGNAGAGALAFAGGPLYLQGGNASGTGNANGGNIILSGGAGAGSGTKGLTIIDIPAFTTASNASCSVNCSITQGYVDGNGNVIVNATATGLEINLPDPTNTTAGRILYITVANTSSEFTLTINGGGTGNQIAMRANASATMVWNGTDWTVAGASSSTTLQAAYDNTLTSAGGAEIILNNTASSNGLTVRNNPTNPIMGAVFEVQSSIGTSLLSVNNNAVEYVTNGGAETSGASSSTFPSNTWEPASTGGTVSRNTTLNNVATGQASVQIDTSLANHGVKNNLTTGLAISTTYQLSLTGKLSSGTFTTVDVYYSRDGGTTLTACATAQAFVTTGWSKITCTFTTDGTTATNPDVIIRQSDSITRTLWIDNLSVTLSTTVSTPPNVQIGGGIYGGTPTLLTLDRSSSPPVTNGNDVYFGSMYYDTTSDRIQCYEADGWGACGSAPDNFVNLVPEYAGAVLNGTGIGTMTADFCANSAALSVNSSLCTTGQALNFYRWTSPQATQQTYSIYVTYQLPAAFKRFANDSTVTLTARTDSTTNASVTYQMFRSEGGSLTACGSETSVTTTINLWQTVGINGNEETGCGFSTSSANNNVIFKINVKANSNANVYVGTLSFTTIGQ